MLRATLDSDLGTFRATCNAEKWSVWAHAYDKVPHYPATTCFTLLVFGMVWLPGFFSALQRFHFERWKHEQEEV